MQLQGVALNPFADDRRPWRRPPPFHVGRSRHASETSMTQNLKIDVYVELICPWCLIGKSNLESALDQLAATDPELHVQVQWHTVQLVPQVPPEGWPFAEFYLNRLGSPEAVRQRQAQVRAAAAQAGVEIDLARIERFPNTTLAHRLLAFAGREPSVVDAMMDRLFEAYFQRGQNIGDFETLLDIAHELGLDRGAAAAALDTEPTHSPVSPAAVTGVPLFVFNEKFSLSGAQ